MAVLRIGSKCSHDKGLSPLPVSRLAVKKFNKALFLLLQAKRAQPANLNELSAILEITSVYLF